MAIVAMTNARRTLLACWRRGIRDSTLWQGGGFFSRQEQATDNASAAQDKQLEDYKAQAIAVKTQCETWRAQWASGQAAHTQQNANLINDRCAQYEQARTAYNAAVAQHTANVLQANMGDHPADQ